MRLTPRAFFAVAVIGALGAISFAAEAEAPPPAPTAAAVRLTSKAQLAGLPAAQVIELGDKSRTTAGALRARLAELAPDSPKTVAAVAAEKKVADEAFKTSGAVLLPGNAVHCGAHELCYQNEANVSLDGMTSMINVGAIGVAIWDSGPPTSFKVHLSATLAPGWVLDHVTFKTDYPNVAPPTGFAKGAKELAIELDVNGVRGSNVVARVWVYVKGPNGERTYPDAHLAPLAPVVH